MVDDTTHLLLWLIILIYMAIKFAAIIEETLPCLRLIIFKYLVHTVKLTAYNSKKQVYTVLVLPFPITSFERTVLMNAKKTPDRPKGQSDVFHTAFAETNGFISESTFPQNQARHNTVTYVPC